MKKSKLIATLCTLILTLACLTFGVYSAVKTSFTASGSITFNAYNLDVLVHGEIIGAIDNGSLVADYKKATVSAHNVAGYTTSGNGTLPAWSMGGLAFDELNENNLITIKFTIVNYSKYPIEASATIANQSTLESNMNITKTDMYYCYDADYAENGTITPESGEIVLTFAPKSGAGAFNKDLNITIDIKPSDKTPNAESDFEFSAGAIVGNADDFTAGYKGSDTEVIIPKTINGQKVTSIREYAFSGCNSLTTITIPSSVTRIIDYAFSFCSSLTTINFTGTKTQWNAITKESDWNYSTGNYTIHCTDGDIAKA